MIRIPSAWEENSPDSLMDIAIKYCLKDLQILDSFNSKTEDYGLYVPQKICDRILLLCTSCASTKSEVNRLLELFRNPHLTPLSVARLSNTSVDDEALENLCQHHILELNVSKCSLLTKASYHSIKRLKKSLMSLDIGDMSGIIPYLDEKKFIEDAFFGKRSFLTESEHLEYSLDLPHLRSLIARSLKFPEQYPYFQNALSGMSLLTHLDLSRCENLDGLNCIARHTHLQSLILYNVEEVPQCISNICTLKQLRHLDISQSKEEHQIYQKASQVLSQIVTSLEHLISIDISGTNLAGHKVHSPEEKFDNENMGSEVDGDSSNQDLLTDIRGLRSRVARPLEFLGLYNEAHSACYRHHIPAKKISGDSNEDQVLTACQAYCHRPEIAHKALSDLFQIFRYSQCQNIWLALSVILECMRRNMNHKHVQITGSASLFYIVKSAERFNFSIKVKQKIITIVLEAMCTHLSEVTMLRNGCLTLIHFKIPDDVFFVYERLVQLLLIVASQSGQEDFVQRVSVYLLNSLACQVDSLEKKLVGDLGAITIMLELIKNRLEQNVCDEVMETAWGTMWNVTDETAINCQRFLERNGMSLFLGCLKTFPEKAELLRNMMGLLGNIAEVKHLRPFLMKDEYIAVFSDLLDSQSDGIEVSYNAAGILSHIASDGAEMWEKFDIEVLTRQQVLDRMSSAIQKWQLKTKRNINYRSFEPILRLLSCHHTPEAQLWAMWALANLTKVYPEKYCSLLKSEGGIEIVKSFNMSHPLNIRVLAEKIIEHCKRYEDYQDAENSV